MRKQERVNIDAKQRVCLGRILTKEERKSFSSFRVYRESGRIVLEPLIEIPAKSHWIYTNPEAMASLQRGLEDIKEGRINELDRDFSKYINDEI
jgi:hypothetical protein